MRYAAAIALLLACGMAQAAQVDWRRVATPADRARLREWRGAWMSALRQVRGGGSAAQAGAQGLLFDPDRALSGPIPPAGAYRCRMFKLGGREAGTPEFAMSVWGRCTVAPIEGGTGFVRESGGQRPVGAIFADTDARAIFLGTVVIGDETRALNYGRDASRDMAGIVERVGEARWRIVLPHPRFESTLDVIELLPPAG
ncbi:DUF4893 domain-containing protein [Sphingomonas sp.]|uniref:DUF4893 domain-containing protein n=1 Tax=Sphingomonas sp. TaxID=28214 RepID=UPI0035BC2F9D